MSVISVIGMIKYVYVNFQSILIAFSIENDLGNQETYEDFIAMLQKIMKNCYDILNPKKYCTIIISDFTVDKKEAPVKKSFSGGLDITAVDLPGAYSMSPFTSEEKVTQDYIKTAQLDAIINIAGIHKMASLVESDYPEMKKVVDINLCGTMLVNRVFHECLAANGRVVIVTSEVAAFDPMPFNGLYSVTKTALDAYAQTGFWPEEADRERQISATARQMSEAVLLGKALQNVPVAGAVGGGVDAVYLNRIRNDF